MSFFSKAAAAVAVYTAGRTIADKVSSIVSETQQAFNKNKFGDVAGSASAAGFKPITKFKLNDMPNDPSQFAKNSTNKLLQNPDKFTVFTFPTDIGKYFIKFSFKSYKRDIALVTVKEDPTLVVVLPIPTSLNDNFSVSYNDAKLGSITGALVEGAIRGAQQAAAGGGGVVKQVAGAAVGAIKEGYDQFIPMGYSAVRQKITNETLGANIDKATGIVPNPHLAAIFQDIGLREHSFTFRFSPKNQNESKILKELIRNIKIRMLPGTNNGDSQTGMIFTFPDIVDISFGPEDEIPYKFQTCVMTSFGANYAPNGTPAFFKDGSPTDIELSMSFKEVRVLTRESFMNQTKDSKTAVQTSASTYGPGNAQ